MNRHYYKQPSRLMLIGMLALGPLLILSGGINISNGSTNTKLYTQVEGIVTDKKRRRGSSRITYYYTYNRTVALGHMSAHKLDREMRNRFAMKRNKSEDMDQLTDRYILKAEQDDRGFFKGSFPTGRHKRELYNTGDRVTVFYRRDKPWVSTLELSTARRTPFFSLLLGLMMTFVGGWFLLAKRSSPTA